MMYVTEGTVIDKQTALLSGTQLLHILETSKLEKSITLRS
jgi:hypothetical protein